MSTWKERITEKICVRIPELREHENLLEGNLANAFEQVMLHTNADKYNTNWDNTLVDCVVLLYNYSNVEGSIQRTNGGVSDSYESSNILSSVLSRRLPKYLKPVDYVFSDERFEMPKD